MFQQHTLDLKGYDKPTVTYKGSFSKLEKFAQLKGSSIAPYRCPSAIGGLFAKAMAAINLYNLIKTNIKYRLRFEDRVGDHRANC